MTTETQAPDPAHACNCPNIGACDGSCAPYIAPAPVKFDLTEARAIVVDAIRRMRAGHVACADLERSAEEFLHATHAAAKSDELWDQTLQERDRYHEVADSLAQAIAKHLGVEIGEHSSANCPWHRALEALEEAAIQAPEGGPQEWEGLSVAHLAKAAGVKALAIMQQLEAAGFKVTLNERLSLDQIGAALAAPAPQAPVATVEDNSQDWAGMDGTTAWHLIERHADNWTDIGKMMGEWLAANQTAPSPAEGDDLPPLPFPALHHVPVGEGLVRNGYSDDQMRTYARAAQANVQPKGTLFPNGLSITKEWLADKLAQGDDADAAAGQRPKRPCDTPPGCNGSNCQGCGEALTPFDAVERALELSSLHAGSVAMNDRDGATAYRQQLRAHLVEHMYPAPSTQAPAPAPNVSWRRMAVAWLRGQAARQAQTNQKYPDHAKSYPRWTQYVETAQRLADELEGERDDA